MKNKNIHFTLMGDNESVRIRVYEKNKKTYHVLFLMNIKHRKSIIMEETELDFNSCYAISRERVVKEILRNMK